MRSCPAPNSMPLTLGNRGSDGQRHRPRGAQAAGSTRVAGIRVGALGPDYGGLVISHVQLFATSWTEAHQSVSRAELWSGLPFPSPRDLPDPGIEPRFPALQADSLPTEPGKEAQIQFSSVAQSCPTLCDPTNCSTPGLPVHHQLPEFTQTHVHRVGDAIQPSHPLSSSSPPAPNSSQH